jgi:hypothetical protein
MTPKARAFILHVGIVCVTLFTLSATSAEAQTNFVVYRAKFVCGFAPGNVPDSGSSASVLPAPYREVQPGSYSTVVNILNARLNGQASRLDGYVFVHGRATAFLPASILVPFDTSSHSRIDCDAITSALVAGGFQADGRFVEGFVMLRARDQLQNLGSDLEVSVVYTYASRRTDANGTGLGSSIDVERIEGKPEVQPE